MTEWKETTLADLCTDISYGYTESAKQERVGPKFLRITDIASGRLEWKNVPYCPINESDFEKYKLLPGDIVIARTGATTGANYTIKESDPKDVVFASYLIRYKINPQIANPYYIGQLLRSPNWSDYVDAIAGGSAQPGANAKQLGSFDILLPPLPKQKAIAETLSSLDDKIDLLHRQNKTLEQMAETLFRQWFVEEAKEDWEEGTLGKLVDIDTGFAFKSKFYEEDGNLRVVRGKNVTIGSLRWGSDAKFWNETVEGLERYFLEKWDIVIGMDGSRIGQNRSLVLESDLPAILAQRVARLRAKRSKQQPFIWKHIFSDDFKEYISAIHTGTSIPHISQGQISDYEIVLPPNELIDKYSEIVQSFWDKYEQNSMQIQNLVKMRDTLLPKLMSGEVTLN